MLYDDFSTQELAERWMDQRQVQNLMGRYIYHNLVRRERDIFDSFWCREAEPELGLNDGFYKGAEAICGYYGAVDENTRVRTKHMQKLFPDYLGLPKPNVPQTIREAFYPGRPNSELVRLPEPYGTFSETFSYGSEVE